MVKAQTSSDRRRAWTGPALLSHGFRPFFLGAGLWAVVAMVLWLWALMGGGPQGPFTVVDWHAHALMFGYLGAALAGFLLTAVPNWTGRLPVTGWALGGLAALWIAGRVVVTWDLGLGAGGVAAVDLAFPLVLGAVIAREIVSGKNWKNLVVLGLLALLTLGNVVFHWQAIAGGAAQGAGLRIGLAAGVGMVALIGGRVVPSFTRNWLAKRGSDVLPVAMNGYDRLCLLALSVGLLFYVVAPVSRVTGAALLVVAALHLVRLWRWRGLRTGAEPLVAILHIGYAFIPLGALGIGLSVFWPEVLPLAVAQHLWLAGAIGVMTLAVMTRATLGHTGGGLSAGLGTAAIYAALVGAVLARVAAGIWPAQAEFLHMIAGAGWVLAFAGFVALYGPRMLRPRG